MNFSVTILGNSSATPTKNRFPTAHVLNIRGRFFLIDCGEGTQRQMMRNNINTARLNHIFITHLHGDHVFGLFGLLSTLNLDGRRHDMHIYGFSQLEYVLNDFMKYFGENFTYKIVFHAVDVRHHTLVYEDKSISVESIPMKHGVPCCGYLFKEKQPQLNIRKEMIERYNISLAEIAQIKNGSNLNRDSVIPNSDLAYIPYQARSYAFCSDTKYNEKIVDIIRDVDLLYHEATYTHDMEKQAQKWGHSTAQQAAQIAKLANAKQLIIGHFSARHKSLQTLLDEARQVFSETFIAEENKTFEIELKKNKTT